MILAIMVSLKQEGDSLFLIFFEAGDFFPERLGVLKGHEVSEGLIVLRILG